MKAKSLPPIEELRYFFAVRTDGALIKKRKRIPSEKTKPGDVMGTPIGSRGYMIISYKKQRILVHRLIWALVNNIDPGDLDVDHIDRNKANNRPSNLRLATRSQNCANRITKGVRRNKSNKFQAYIYKNRTFIHLGIFNTEEDARAAHAAAKLQTFGEYAHV